MNVGQWHNPENFDARFVRCENWPWPHVPSPYHKTIYEFTLYSVNPATFQMADGRFIQPDRHCQETDWGSIPPPFHGLYPPDERRPCYAFHDSGCRDEGFYVSPTLEGPFEFKPFLRWEVDAVLRDSLLAYGVEPRRVNVIYRAVRLFAVLRGKR